MIIASSNFRSTDILVRAQQLTRSTDILVRATTGEFGHGVLDSCGESLSAQDAFQPQPLPLKRPEALECYHRIER
ncbi:MAG: hypothetical protein P3X24_006235, partial [bacterium]|nr:hypothetical protein [bacterium]